MSKVGSTLTEVLRARYGGGRGYDEEFLVDRIREHATLRPEHLAVVDDNGTMTYAELVEVASRLANALATRGVHRGDRVIVHLGNCREFVVVHVALQVLGAITVPMAGNYREREMTFISKLCEPVCAVTARGPESLWLDTYVSLRDGGHVGLVLAHGTDLPSGVESIEALVDSAAPRELTPGFASSYDVAEIVFTSGSTGDPKGVMWTENNLWRDVHQDALGCKIDRDAVVYTPCTLGHQLGFSWAMRLPLHVGATAVYQQRWVPDASLARIDALGVTTVISTATFLIDALATRRSRPRALHTWICSGSPCPVSVQDELASEWPGAALYQNFGMTEVGTVLINTPEAPREKRASQGKPVGDLELRVVDAFGRPVQRGHRGEMQVRSPGIMAGYYMRQDLTDALITDDGFIPTGDEVVWDDDDFVKVTGRIKDLIKRGGESIAPSAVEAMLLGADGIHEVAVIGLPDARLGERVVAVVVPSDDGRVPSLEAIRKYALSVGLPKSNIPEEIVLVAELPRVAIGKVDKKSLRERLSVAPPPIATEANGPRDQ